MAISVLVSVGECLDKLSILEIKAGKIEDDRLKYIKREMDALVQSIEQACGREPFKGDLYDQLVEVNSELWDLEDEHREEIAQANGAITPAGQSQHVNRCFYIGELICRTNDRRAQIKNQINLKFDKELREVKQLPSY